MLDLLWAVIADGTMESGSALSLARVVDKEAAFAAGVIHDEAIEALERVALRTAAQSDFAWSEHRDTLMAQLDAELDRMVGFDDMTDDQVLTRLKRVYTQTIATNYNDSLHAQFFSQAGKERYPFIQYLSEYDKRVCWRCMPLDGRYFAKSDPYTGYILPQNHFACRCEVRQATEAETRRNPALIARSAHKYLMNVDLEYRYDKSGAGWARVEVDVA